MATRWVVVGASHLLRLCISYSQLEFSPNLIYFTKMSQHEIDDPRFEEEVAKAVDLFHKKALHEFTVRRVIKILEEGIKEDRKILMHHAITRLSQSQ